MTGLRRARPVVALLLGLMVCGSCFDQDTTEIVVVVYADFEVPAALDVIRIEVDATAIGGRVTEARGALSSADDLPIYVGVSHSGGALGPLLVTAIGESGGSAVVERSARVSFVPDRVLVLRLDLLRGCAGLSCEAEQTCAERGCQPRDVATADLPDWTGSPDPSADAGTSEGCFGASIENDVQHCGACGAACPGDPTHVEDATCDGGLCMMDCTPGFADCNGDASDGCESDLSTDPEHCGACDTGCAVPGVVTSCVDSSCVVSGCDDGFDDCNGDTADGCEIETSTDMANCGACDRACPLDSTDVATSSCELGTCAITCEMGSFDCNADDSDGCEATTFDTVENCGACGARCERFRGVTSCATGTCELTGCEPLWEDCNGDPTDGCEQDVGSDPANCGACARVCPLDTTSVVTASCMSGTCVISVCSPNLGDCNMDDSDGCETSLNADRDNCGMCGTVCVAPDNCSGGVCR